MLIIVENDRNVIKLVLPPTMNLKIRASQKLTKGAFVSQKIETETKKKSTKKMCELRLKSSITLSNIS